MFNNNAKHIIVLFAPNSRGNFVKNCLTFSNGTADSSYKCTPISSRLERYISALNINDPTEPAHVDKYNNYSKRRILNADHSKCYIHSGHLFELPQWDKIETMKYKYKSYVVITTSQGLYNDYLFINRFTNTETWYNLPYRDILNKPKFLEHCYAINNNIDLGLVDDYYNVYYDKCIKNNTRNIEYNR